MEPKLQPTPSILDHGPRDEPRCTCEFNQTRVERSRGWQYIVYYCTCRNCWVFWKIPRSEEIALPQFTMAPAYAAG